jgi:hypothetical protein
MQIQITKMIRIHTDPDPQHCFKGPDFDPDSVSRIAQDNGFYSKKTLESNGMACGLQKMYRRKKSFLPIVLSFSFFS